MSHRPYLRVYKALVDSQEQRGLRREWILDERGELGIGWAVFERMVVWGKVNQIRKEMGKDEVLIKEIRKVENQAMGHSDYTKKYALGAEEVILS